MARNPKTIVLTGASGVIGKALVPELGNHRVVCLVHRGAPPEGAAEAARTDVAEPRLGLARDEYRRLAKAADVVIHSAAVTDWAADPALIRRVNVGGTENVLAFARDAGAPVHHLSTSFIQAVADEAPVDLDDSNVIVNYCRSKVEGEEAVRASGVPHTIYRPTNLIGDSRTGEIAASQAVQLVSEMICRGKVPLFPARPDTLVDVVPQDLVAKAIAAAVERDDIGLTWWLTGGDGAMAVDDALDACVELMASVGRPIARPTVIDPRDVRAEVLEGLGPMARSFFPKMIDFSEGLSACGIFPSSLDEVSERYGLPAYSWPDAYMRGLEFWAAKMGYREASAAPPAG